MGKDSQPATVAPGLTVINVEMNPTIENGNRNIARRISDAVQNKVFSGTREEGNFTLGCLKLFHTRTRFLIMLLVLFCLTSIWSNILCFNFALICMQHSTNSENGTTVTEFTPQQKSYLTAAVAASALLANFFIVSLVNQFGIRTIFTILGLLSAAATASMPFAISNGFYYTLAARLVQGLAFAANFPVIGAFASKWTYYKQNGLFVSVLVAYVQLSPALSMPTSGAICASSLGWPSVFYAHGIVATIIFLTFGAFYRNSPGKHPYVGAIELRKIAVGKTEVNKKDLKSIPYGPILKTAAVWAIWIAALGNFTAVNMLFLFSPNFLHHVLKFPVRNTGLSASIPPLCQFLVKLLAGFTSDKIRFISETNKLRLYNTIAFCGSATAFVALAFAPVSWAFGCLILLGASAGILGCTTGGFFKAGPLISKHYSHFVTGNVSLGITLTMLVVPFVVTGLAPDNTAEQWTHVFFVTASVLIVTNLIFVAMCSAEPAHWTTDEFSRSVSRNKVHATGASKHNFPPQSG